MGLGWSLGVFGEVLTNRKYASFRGVIFRLRDPVRDLYLVAELRRRGRGWGEGQGVEFIQVQVQVQVQCPPTGRGRDRNNCREASSREIIGSSP